jgi:hypothetical protein
MNKLENLKYVCLMKRYFLINISSQDEEITKINIK